jgi:hypothetical protein
VLPRLLAAFVLCAEFAPLKPPLFVPDVAGRVDALGLDARLPVLGLGRLPVLPVPPLGRAGCWPADGP